MSTKESTKLNLLPPIIDNTIGAFPIQTNIDRDKANNVLPISFYFQKDVTNSQSTKEVILKLTIGGEPILKHEYKICPCKPPVSSNRLTLTQYEDESAYEIQINEEDLKEGTVFKINTPISIFLATISKEVNTKEIKSEEIGAWINNVENIAKHSVFSDSVTKYAITQPTFTLYGGLSSDEVIAPETFNDRENKKLLTTKKNKQIFAENIYRIRGDLTFAQNEANTNIPEDDVLLWYQAQFYVNGSKWKDSTLTTEWPSTGGRAYPNRFWDTTNRIFYFEFAENAFAEINNTDDVELALLYATSKGYKETLVYPIVVQQQSAEDKQYDTALKWSKEVIATPNNDRGYIHLEGTLKNESGILRTGTLYCQRAVIDGTGILNYKTIFRRTQILLSNEDNRIIYDDFSAEAGTLYKYKFFFRYETETEQNGPQLVYSEDSISSDVCLLIEDMFLTTKDMTLKIRYNPELTSLKKNIQDIVTPTLGGEYPFIRRNGAQKYKTFTIGGLISYHGEESNEWIDWLPYITEIDSVQKKTPDKDKKASSATVLEPSLFSGNLFAPLNVLLEFTFPAYPKSLSHYDLERLKEKLFRDKVLDFLYSGETMLFKSFQEGNAFVKLTNISLTANKQLDRNIYSFTAQAVEVMAPSEENYANFFSEETTYASYILQRVYLHTDKTVTTSIGTIGVYALEEDSYSPKNQIFGQKTSYSKVKIEYYKATGELTETLEDGEYLDSFGRIITVINGKFKPGEFPKIKATTEEVQTTVVKNASNKVYRTVYSFDTE